MPDQYGEQEQSVPHEGRAFVAHMQVINRDLGIGAVAGLQADGIPVTVFRDLDARCTIEIRMWPVDQFDAAMEYALRLVLAPAPKQDAPR